VPLLDITSLSLDLRVGHALVARCLAFASNDSMGLHLAVASGVPTVGLFGVSPPLAYAPLLQPLLASGPGGMDGIDPADVADAVLAWLGRGNPAIAMPPAIKVAPAVGRAVTP
jgi:heptosyltransferase-2